MVAWRSLLSVPGDRPDRLAEAHGRGADAIIIDLEDSVAASEKVKARDALSGAVAALHGAGADVIVRINVAWRLAVADIEAAIAANARVLIIPKVEDPTHLITISEMLSELEAERGLPDETVGLIALIESPAALWQLPAIAAEARVSGLALGTEDFSRALGVAPTEQSLTQPCQQIALAASARRLMAFALPISIAEFRDLAAYEEAARKARAMGGTGGICVHPAQIEIINKCFQPAGTDYEAARPVKA